jgi:DNA mismatch repair ATPase MutS
MNVFLMHRSRDLYPARDPVVAGPATAQDEEIKAILSMTKDRPLKLRGRLPAAEPALVQDLELNTLFEAMAQGDQFLLEIARRVVLSSLTDLDSIRYRQEILRDCLKNPATVRDIYRIPLESLENQQRHWMGIFSSHPSGVLGSAVELLEMFVGLLQKLRRIADEHAEQFESEGFRRFFAMIQRELDDDYFATVENHLSALKFRGGVLLSAQLGDANEGTNYVLHRANHGERNWLKRVFARKSPIYSYTLHPRDESGARALGDLRDRGLDLVANAAAQSANHIDNFLKVLRLELAFYIGCLNLHEQLVQLGEPIAIPEPAPAAERGHSFTGLYDVCLALTMKQKVVGNDLNARHKELFVITGANQGGKSTFLRSIGLAQLMMQSGLFVPAETFSANVCRRLFTHFKREEDASMKSGKFDEELGRMSDIVDDLAPDSMLLFNESFAATNEREGSEIARQIVQALLDQRVMVFYVTHLYELARSFYGRALDNIIFLRAERQSDGSRTFKLIEGEPLETSYGVDLYNGIFG